MQPETVKFFVQEYWAKYGDKGRSIIKPGQSLNLLLKDLETYGDEYAEVMNDLLRTHNKPFTKSVLLGAMERKKKSELILGKPVQEHSEKVVEKFSGSRSQKHIENTRLVCERIRELNKQVNEGEIGGHQAEIKFREYLTEINFHKEMTEAIWAQLEQDYFRIWRAVVAA